MKKNSLFLAVQTAVAAIAAPVLFSNYAIAQDTAATGNNDQLEYVIVTGSRLKSPGLESSSLITSIDEAELDSLQEPGIETVLRNSPFAIPGDNANVNNGSAGAQTVNLRGLGTQRNLVLVNGRRLVPYNVNGIVDTTGIPSALIEDIQVITGGASAVYGSDAIAGAINVILKSDFEGVELELGHSETGEGDGKQDRLFLTIGSNFGSDRGNAVLSLGYSDRDPVLLGQRALGLLGINSNTGSGLAEYLAGEPPIPPTEGCGGPNVVDIDGSGSPTSIPTRFEIPGTDVIGQFREDGTLGDECSNFNFSPFNYYQTPLEKFSATALVNFEINENFDVYGSVNFSNSSVTQQVAPSGTFSSNFELPLANPFIGDQARTFIIDGANAAVTAGTLEDGGNWNDVNQNGTVDIDDRLTVALPRRTLELGPRTTRFDTDNFQLTAGLRGAINDSWEYDAFYSYGETNRTNIRDGYTNLTNIQAALLTTDGVTCENGDATCVPIDLFGGFGTITEEMAGYARAIGIYQEKYEQEVISLNVTGSVDMIQLPTASDPLALSAGVERREETGILEPDECLKLAPASCQGGAGGNLLPIKGGYTVEEFFVEAGLPLLEDLPGAQSVDLEVGFRSADYNTTGRTDSWKLGANWRPVEPVLIRVMQQNANRAPNVGELFAQVTSGLDNASGDPCSSGNNNINDELRQRCIDTGMLDAQVGVVPDIAASQINSFSGADPLNPPDAETADTFTAGIVFTPEISALDDFTLSVDYYDIDIQDIIGTASAQQTLDGCYNLGIAEDCARIRRVDGGLRSNSAGVELFTTNLNYFQVEGLEIALGFGVSLGDYGDLRFGANINKYLTHEQKTANTAPVLDCLGFYSTSCDPISDIRWVQRTTWTRNDVSVTLSWRHLGAVDVEPEERELRFEPFRSIDAYNYLDLSAAYDVSENLSLRFGVDNLLDKEPPVVGNNIVDTSSGSGNTLPGNYDVLGRTYKATLNFRI